MDGRGVSRKGRGVSMKDLGVSMTSPGVFLRTDPHRELGFGAVALGRGCFGLGRLRRDLPSRRPSEPLHTYTYT